MIQRKQISLFPLYFPLRGVNGLGKIVSKSYFLFFSFKICLINQARYGPFLSVSFLQWLLRPYHITAFFVQDYNLFTHYIEIPFSASSSSTCSSSVNGCGCISSFCCLAAIFPSSDSNNLSISVLIAI